MMLVLVIISFLILAIPPLVHKKFTKRITRGEHGRYECWKDIEGNTYEYYATEKNGIEPEYIGSDRGGTASAPMGRKLAAGERCTFNPKTKAPNAAYFSFQAIGGGSGGSYAPYKGNDGVYRNDNFVKTAKIKSAYGDSYNTPTYSSGSELSGKNESNFDNVKLPSRNFNYHNFFFSHADDNNKQLTFHFNEAELFLDYDYHKTNGIKILMAQDDELNWIKDYFTSVKATDTFVVQTPAGHSGTPYLDNQGFTDVELDKDGTKKNYRNFKLVWGGKGSPGFEAEFSDPRVGYEEPITINFSYPVSLHNGVGSDMSYYFANTSKYAFFLNISEQTPGAAEGNYTRRWVKLCSEENQVEGCTSIEGTPIPEDLALGCLNENGPFSNSHTSTCWSEGISDILSTYNFGQPVSSLEDSTYGFSAKVTFNQRENKLIPLTMTGGAPYMRYCAHQSTPETITIPFGITGTNATAEMENQPPMATIPIYGSTTTLACPINYTMHALSDRSITRLTTPKKLEDIFPKEITMTNEKAFITPTYGYAGGSGKSVLMMLPALQDNLEFEIGNGGAAGTKTKHVGGIASDTIVWAKESTVSGNCSDGTTGCSQILDAKGGVGVMGGAAATKLFLRGYNTNCDGGTRTSSGGFSLSRYNPDFLSPLTLPLTVEEAAGCIDKGVATYTEAPKRFSISSGFYAIPELDSKSKTPSAIDTFYKNVYSYVVSSGKRLTFLPGTGGDGGYSFIVNNGGTEKVSASGHTNFNADILLKEKGQSGWTDNGSSSVIKNYTNILPDVTAIQNEYKCYQITDSDSAMGTGEGYGDSHGFEIVDEKVYACKPSIGYPGAVVIVW